MDWETLKADCLACSRCELCKTRTNVVFGQGVPDAEVLFVGEGPGQSEDEQRQIPRRSFSPRAMTPAFWRPQASCWPKAC